MSRLRTYSLFTFSTLAIVMLCGVVPAVGQSEPAPAFELPALDLEAVEAAKKADPFIVPDGDAETLLKYIDSLGRLRPESRDIKTITTFLRKQTGAVIEASGKVFSAEATQEQKAEAAEAEFKALMARLTQLRESTARDAMERLHARLVKSGLADLARKVRNDLLRMDEHDMTSGRLDAKTPAQLTEEIKAFVAEKPDRETFHFVFALIRQFERERQPDQLGAMCDAFIPLYANSSDPLAAEFVKNLEGISRRTKLLGHPMKLQGTTLDGNAFDWGDYQGKVTLVIYWSTTCRPCLVEMKNVHRLYQIYHDRGFEVVAVSLDDDRASLDAFFARNKMPWTVLFDDDQTPDKPKHPSAAYYTIIFTPTMILVGPEGKVVALDVRGPRLEEELVRLLGPAENTPPDANP